MPRNIDLSPPPNGFITSNYSSINTVEKIRRFLWIRSEILEIAKNDVSQAKSLMSLLVRNPDSTPDTFQLPTFARAKGTSGSGLFSSVDPSHQVVLNVAPVTKFTLEQIEHSSVHDYYHDGTEYYSIDDCPGNLETLNLSDWFVSDGNTNEEDLRVICKHDLDLNNLIEPTEIVLKVDVSAPIKEIEKQFIDLIKTKKMELAQVSSNQFITKSLTVYDFISSNLLAYLDLLIYFKVSERNQPSAAKLVGWVQGDNNPAGDTSNYRKTIRPKLDAILNFNHKEAHNYLVR